MLRQFSKCKLRWFLAKVHAAPLHMHGNSALGGGREEGLPLSLVFSVLSWRFLGFGGCEILMLAMEQLPQSRLSLQFELSVCRESSSSRHYDKTMTGMKKKKE